jgi:hypothetical protein
MQKKEKIRRSKNMRYDAFFISPGGKIIPVPIRHIVTIAKDPDLFGLTSDYIKSIYKKHNEDVGWEGYARNEIILALLKDDWIRLRFYSRSGTWRIQIFNEMSDKLQDNIRIFYRELKRGNVTNLMERSADPNIEIHNTLENRIFWGTLDEGIDNL